MKKPTGNTWLKTLAFTWLSSIAAGYFLHTPLTWRELFSTLNYAIAFATVVWLIALARWHRAIIKG